MGSRKPTKNMICFPSDGASFFFASWPCNRSSSVRAALLFAVALSDDGPKPQSPCKNVLLLRLAAPLVR